MGKNHPKIKNHQSSRFSFLNLWVVLGWKFTSWFIQLFFFICGIPVRELFSWKGSLFLWRATDDNNRHSTIVHPRWLFWISEPSTVSFKFPRWFYCKILTPTSASTCWFARFLHRQILDTLPETNSSPLKMGGPWKRRFLLESTSFRSQLLVLGSVVFGVLRKDQGVQLIEGVFLPFGRLMDVTNLYFFLWWVQEARDAEAPYLD